MSENKTLKVDLDVQYILNLKKIVNEEELNLVKSKLRDKHRHYYASVRYEKMKDLYLPILNEIVEIYSLQIPEFEKLYKMSFLIGSSQELKNAYRWFVIPMINTSFIDDLVKIEEFYIKAEENDAFETIKYIKNKRKYFECYKYASFLISSYIENSKSYNTKIFLDTYGIDSEIFNYCIKVIEELDVDLFNRYKEKYKANMQVRYNIKIQKFEEISLGIKTGKLSTGKEFDILDFYKLVPFKSNAVAKEDFHEMIKINPKLKYHSSFIQRISSYLRETLPEEYYTIMNYIQSNKVVDGVNDFVSPEVLKEWTTIINNRRITNEENELIFKYIEQNNLPKIHGVYREIRNRYLNGDITDEDIIQKEVKIIKKSKQTKPYIINSSIDKES